MIAPVRTQKLPSLFSPTSRLIVSLPSPTKDEHALTLPTMDAGQGQGPGRSADPPSQQSHVNMDSTDMTANEMSLREQLLSAQHQQHPSPQNAVAHPVQSPSSQHQLPARSATPPQHQHPHGGPPPMDYQAQHQRSPIDPAIAAQYSMQHVAQQSSQLQQGGSTSDMDMSGIGPPQNIAPMPEGGLPGSSPPGQDASADGRKARRELSQSKRAAQNRAAQRAFRQRKESYIKKLEDDVRNAATLPALQEEYHRVQSENYHLRDYIMALQSRLLEVNGDYPPPPSNIDLRDPRQFQQQNGDQAGSAPIASMGGGDVEQLQAAAAQAAGFGAGAGADKPDLRRES